ncbi:MAG: hypothetical protein DRP45_03460 [Candidatus Zixiibacteriota bacterium]|nr:MAG: hypothetical protein DRP45_03460 [candidate division Zixibacteria bacterium]
MGGMHSTQREQAAQLVLDLDLDCFVKGIAICRSDECDRLDDSGYPPWSDNDFRHFLESQCGLCKSKRKPGRIFEHHWDTYSFWQKLISSGRLRAPFEVIHVDAHSDLDYGEYSWEYLTTKYLAKPPEERRLVVTPRNGLITTGNWFAIANRWICGLTFVHHRTWPDHPDNNDLPDYYFKDYDKSSGIIKMPHLDPEQPNDAEIENWPIIHYEPEIPFCKMSVNDYAERRSFDFVSLSKSPPFTPASADRLVEIFREYIREV